MGISADTYFHDPSPHTQTHSLSTCGILINILDRRQLVFLTAKSTITTTKKSPYFFLEMNSLFRKDCFLSLVLSIGLLVIQSSVQALAHHPLQPPTVLPPRVLPKQRQQQQGGNLLRQEQQLRSSLVLFSLSIRGGEQQQSLQSNNKSTSAQTSTKDQPQSSPPMASSTTTTISTFPLTAMALAMGKFYATALTKHPIWTKSITSCVIFGLSDYLAQRIEGRGSSSSSTTNAARKEEEERATQTLSSTDELNWTRLLTSMAVGLIYFGPAAHFWYNWMFQLFPNTGLVSTLQKAAMGQAFFGPFFTCIFFASILWQARQFTIQNWLQKIRCDLPGAWLAGLGYWPLVDLLSYSLVPVQYIPLFINVCSLIWTIYLSIVANRSSSSSGSRSK